MSIYVFTELREFAAYVLFIEKYQLLVNWFALWDIKSRVKLLWVK